MMSWRWWLLASGLQGEKIQEEGISAYVDCVPIYIYTYIHIYISWRRKWQPTLAWRIP